MFQPLPEVAHCQRRESMELLNLEVDVARGSVYWNRRTIRRSRHGIGPSARSTNSDSVWEAASPSSGG